MPKQGKPARLDYSSEFGLPRTYQQTYGLQCVFFVLCDILLFSGVTMMLEIRFVNEIVTSTPLFLELQFLIRFTSVGKSRLQFGMTLEAIRCQIISLSNLRIFLIEYCSDMHCTTSLSEIRYHI